MAQKLMDKKMIKMIDEEHAKREALLLHIQAGELTVEEAATSFAGWRLKHLEAMGRVLSDGTKVAIQRHARVDLESRLPDWQGLSLTRHFGAR